MRKKALAQHVHDAETFIVAHSLRQRRDQELRLFPNPGHVMEARQVSRASPNFFLRWLIAFLAMRSSSC